jgi:hypothetical protein
MLGNPNTKKFGADFEGWLFPLRFGISVPRFYPL